MRPRHLAFDEVADDRSSQTSTLASSSPTLPARSASRRHRSSSHRTTSTSSAVLTGRSTPSSRRSSSGRSATHASTPSESSPSSSSCRRVSYSLHRLHRGVLTALSQIRTSPASRTATSLHNNFESASSSRSRRPRWTSSWRSFSFIPPTRRRRVFTSESSSQSCFNQDADTRLAAFSRVTRTVSYDGGVDRMQGSSIRFAEERLRHSSSFAARSHRPSSALLLVFCRTLAISFAVASAWLSAMRVAKTKLAGQQDLALLGPSPAPSPTSRPLYALSTNRRIPANAFSQLPFCSVAPAR